MASRPDLSMLQNLNRRLRTGLWQVPPQWKALRRTPGWSYHPQPVQRISVPHQHLYPLVFERLPMLRLEGHRLGEIAVNSTGSNSNSKSLTQRIVLRWWSLTQDKMNPLTLDQSFERVRKEFEPHLQQYANYLTRTKEASVSRHAQLSVAKVEKDALDQELGRPARYSEQLESLVNHALNRQPTDPHQYFSPQVSRKLIKMINRKKIRQRLTTQTETLREALDNSTLGKRSNEVLNNGSDASVASSSSSLSSSSSSTNPNVNLDVPSNVPSVGPPATSADSIINSFPTDSTGEPIPSPELFFQFEKAWSTSIGKMSGRRKKRALTSIGNAKSHKVTEFTRHIDEMHAEPDAKLADYLAYVLYTQIITLQYKSLESWLPYTHYLNHRIFFHAFRLLHTSIKTSSVVTGSIGLLPKVRHLKLAPKSWSFQQALTHQRLLVLVENHLATAPLHSFKEDVHSLAEVDHDVGVVKKAALPLTPFWQEVMDEKVRIKHLGESWYNSRVQEMIDNDTLDQEAMRIEREEKMKWLEERAAAAAREEAEKAKEE